MAQAGSFVPAREAKLPLVDRIFARVGASTTSRAASPRSWWRCRRRPASCTSPRRAASSSSTRSDGHGDLRRPEHRWAVAEHLATNSRAAPDAVRDALPRADRPGRRGARRGELPRHGAQYHDEIVFLRKIVAGRSDRSYGIQVARLAGLPPAVVERAREILSGLEQDELARGAAP